MVSKLQRASTVHPLFTPNARVKDTGVTLSIYMWVWGDLNSGPHAVQQALLTLTEPSSRPLVAGFEIYRCEVSNFVLWFQNCSGYSDPWKPSLYFQALSIPRGNPAVVW